MIRLVPRETPSALMVVLAPALAFALSVFAGAILFALMGKPPLEALRTMFIAPLSTWNGLGELLVKATPLILIAAPLALGFRGGIWNIGAEGQFVAGAIVGGSVALAFYPLGGWWLLVLMWAGGILGGMAWAAVPALLRTRFGASEILVSLMLTYVAVLLLGFLMHGPLRDPQGMNFPESRLFQVAMPLLLEGTRAHIGFVFALAAAIAAWVIVRRHLIGFQLDVLGLAPQAARFTGFSERRLVWVSLLLSGAAAGLAGICDAAGPVGQLVPSLPVGYGFTAIIVAFLGRLNPLGIVVAGLVMALTYLGGEAVQVRMSLPSATTSVFQGLILFFLLACDVLILYRPQRAARAEAG